MRHRLTVACAAIMLLWAGAAMAQQTGTLDGTVTDPSGNGLPGVQVTIEGPALLQARTVFTGGNGYWRAPGLPPGTYTVTFSLDGFNSVEQPGVVVNVGRVYTITTNMQLATVTEMVTVTSKSPLVDTGSSKLGGIYSEALLQNIPNARDYYDVMRSMPGVNEADPGSSDRRTITVHGSSVRGNSYAVDGIDISDPVVAYASTNINYDQIAEIEVQTGGLPAEIGSADGGYVNIVTKSGGNNFSGEGGFFFQNDSLQGTNIDESDPRFEGFERGTSLDQAIDVSGAVGGPVARDRIWFFGSARALRNDTIAIGVDDIVPIDENQYFVKGTGQINPDHQAVFSYNRFERIEPNFGIATDVAPEATYNRDEAVNTWLAQWNGVFGQAAYADFRFGQSNRDFPLLFQDNATRVVFDLATGVTTGAAFLQRRNDRKRTQANGSLTYFAQDWGTTSHELKGGFEYERARFTWDVEGGGPGGVNAFYYPIAGDPFLVGLARTPLVTQEAIDKYAFYLQDAINVGNLTINAGVRWDLTEGWTPAQGFAGNQWSGLGLDAGTGVLDAVSHPESRNDVDWSEAAPRLGVAYDIFGDGRTVARAFYGRYYNKLIIQFFDFANPNGLGGTLSFWSDGNGDGFVQASELSSAIAVWGGATGGIDENLKQPYTDEFNVGVEHELFTDFALGVNFVLKRQRDLIEDVDVGVPSSAYTAVQRTDPGPDETLGTSDDQQLTVFAQDTSFTNSYVLQSPPDAFRDYEAVEITARKRLGDNWQLFSSFVWEDSTGNVDTSYGGSTGRSADFDNPNERINDEGHLTLEREWQFKAQATYLAPYGINLSGYYRFLSGQPRTRQVQFTDLPQGSITVNAEPRGSSKLDDQSILDFRVEKQFEVGNQARLGLMLDVFNLTNENSVIDQRFTTAVNLGTVAAIIPPRIARLGVRVIF